MTTTRAVMCWILAAFYVIGGLGHFVAIDRVVQIVPDVVPYPRAIVIVTGILETAGAIALLIPRWRRLAGIMLALYAVCVFPANIKHAVDGSSLLPFAESWWYHGPRIAMQPVIVWWALFCAGVIDWPARTSRSL